MLIERGAIVPQGDRWVATDDDRRVEIPETLHGLLLARIDQLPDSAKRSLRDRRGDRPPVPGARPGARRSASAEHDAPMTDRHAARHPRGEGPDPPGRARARARVPVPPRAVQDAAYESLLKQERRELHGRVGEALEELYPERAGELAPVLAMHFEQAGETEQGDRLLRRRRRSTRVEQNAIQEAFAALRPGRER